MCEGEKSGRRGISGIVRALGLVSSFATAAAQRYARKGMQGVSGGTVRWIVGSSGGGGGYAAAGRFKAGNPKRKVREGKRKKTFR
jgi:hypothetical protein